MELMRKFSNKKSDKKDTNHKEDRGDKTDNQQKR